MYNSITLIAGYEEIRDQDGFKQKTPIKIPDIPATFLSVTRSEEVHANQMKYKADFSAETMACNYNNEPEIIDDLTGTIYTVKRAYKVRNGNKVHLTCERRDTNGN